MTAVVPNKTVRGIRESIPSGYYLGRTSSGTGPVELISGALLAQGVDASIAGAGGGQTVLNIKTSGNGITNAAGTFEVEWNAGEVDVIGTGLSIVAGGGTNTLEANWQLGDVTNLNTGLTLSAGTLTPNFQLGTLTNLNTGLTLSAGTLTPDWQGGSVAHLQGLTIVSGNTLQSYWQPGTSFVTALGSGVSINSGTLNVAQNWNGGSVTALGTASTGTLAISSGTLSASYVNPYSAGTLTTFNSGLTLASGTLTPDWNGGSVSAIGNGLTLSSGTLASNSNIQSANVAAGSGAGFTSGTPLNVTSMNLPAGTWLIWATAGANPASNTIIDAVGGWSSTTSATFPTPPNAGAYVYVTIYPVTAAGWLGPVGQTLLTLGSTTTVYLSMFCDFTGGQPGCYGYIAAIRV